MGDSNRGWPEPIVDRQQFNFWDEFDEACGKTAAAAKADALYWSNADKLATRWAMEYKRLDKRKESQQREDAIIDHVLNELAYGKATCHDLWTRWDGEAFDEEALRRILNKHLGTLWTRKRGIHNTAYRWSAIDVAAIA